MAVLAAKRLLEGSLRKTGLVTPADRITTPAELMDHMRATGWTGTMETKRV